MNILLNPKFLDLCTVTFMLLVCLSGIKRGFVGRIYDILTLYVSYILSIKMTPTVSVLLMYFGIDMVEKFGGVVNEFVVYVTIFAGFKVLFALAGNTFLKSVIKKIVDSLKLTAFVDGLLGFGVSLIEGLVIVYFVLMLIMSPLVNGGRDAVNATLVNRKLLEKQPYITQETGEEFVNNLYGQAKRVEEKFYKFMQ